MLTYHQVLTTDLALLTTAAEQWDTAAKKFESVQKDYESQVKAITTDGSWTGQANLAGKSAMQLTHDQYTAAAKEARAIASLLRDAHAQFTELRGKLKSAVADAEKDHMRIGDDGRATWTKRDDPAVLHDPDAPTAIAKAENSWNQRIAEAVRAFDDADQGVKLALTTAVQDATPDLLDGTPHGFNANAEGDIEKVEAKEAYELATKLNSTGHLDAKDMAEMQRLFRDNDHDKAFSQTLLSSLGADNTIKFTNKLNDLAYVADKKHKADYLTLETGLAGTLASATRVPDFKGQDGKPLKYGSAEYSKSYQDWMKTSDATFYDGWREGLKKAGVEKFDLESATNKTNVIGIGHDQKVRGYQSLATLMQQGSGYSPQFLADVTDDMVAAEKKDRDVWDLYGQFQGKETGWFANDPVDAALGIMSRDPATATAYLDPGAGGKDAQHRDNGRLNYFLHDRDWKFTNTTSWQGNIEHRAGDIEEKDSRVGLGAALEAATTGREPGSPMGKPGPHSEGQARVMQDTISILDANHQGDSIPGNLQQPLGRALIHYVPDTHDILDGLNPDKGRTQGLPRIQGSGDDSHLANNQASLIRVLRGVSDDKDTFAALHYAELSYSAERLAGGAQNIDTKDSIHDWETRGAEVGKVSGIYNSIAHDIVLDKRDSGVQWVNDVARYAYHGIGTPITMIPIIGDEAQRTVDAVTYEQSKIAISNRENTARAEGSDIYSRGIDATNTLIDKWAEGRNVEKSNAVTGMRREAGQSFTEGRDAAYTALRTAK
ncbi:hypothetical protein [Streptomyces sp. NPDC037389]|uniref:hypothetical protein n=1 Tax=Streptomyces sp. NPDC037389 TaxID=3155369 RepID=UPI0033FD4876